MSGGVDSSVTAHILKEQGYQVEAVFMRNWDTLDERGTCPSTRDWHDVQAVCKQLDIRCHEINLVKEYWNAVFSHALDEYARGRTPNPDILCNKEIKFGVLLDHIARRLGAFHRSLFPLGLLDKKRDVRRLAIAAGLATADKEESMGICFVGERRRFDEFLAEYLPQHAGDILSDNGKIIGKHKGMFTKTIGQSAGISGWQDKWYIYAKDVASNCMYAVQSRYVHSHF
ncbi:hypothetical protein IW152_000718 [Coemansia sp. BCRC 34962]|nr:hypothetical protein IW152_000718 [Coemansia sp. BCRC 34962]